MRTLYIVRHAKSSWSDAAKSDHARPLNERGLHDAPVMAKRFRERNEPVDLLLSSTAERALSTARFFSAALNDLPVSTSAEIYEADRRTLMHVVESLPEEAHRVILFGHNPGFSELVDHLTGAGLGELPTCAIVRIDLAVEHWNEVAGGIGTYVWSDVPKSGGVS